MSFDTDLIDPGTNPTSPIAVDNVAGAKYQRTKLANPNEDQSGAYGIDSDPIRVRNRRRGSTDYDSGITAITGSAAAPAALTAATLYVLGGYVTNTTAAQIAVTVTNTAGTAIWSSKPIGPRETVELPLRAGAEAVGIKVGAGAGGSTGCNIHVWGEQ